MRDPKVWGPMLTRSYFARSLAREVRAARPQGIDVFVIRPWTRELRELGTNAMRQFDRESITEAVRVSVLSLLEEHAEDPAIVRRQDHGAGRTAAEEGLARPVRKPVEVAARPLDSERMFEMLNEAQRRAATHGDGPLLVIAGAGSGKTKTLAARVAHLTSAGVPPQRILLLTFTRRAAQEMLARAQLASSSADTGRVWGGTFHSVGNRLLRIYGRAVGIPPGFTVMDQGDAADLMNLVRTELELGQGQRRFPKKDTLVAIYSHAVNSGTPLSELLSARFPWCTEHRDALAAIFESYTLRKLTQGVLDYDDLLLYWNALVDAPGVGEQIGSLFDHILVDEYQDTNRLQARILEGMRRSSDNVMVVGDDAQSIYSFRAATVENILSFPQRFPRTTVVKLEQNYRSTQPILAASNAVIAKARRRYAKELWSARKGAGKPVLTTCEDERDQSERVCECILEHRERGVSLMGQAVLFRAGHHSALLEIELARRGIPFVKYGGLKFLEAAHIKDLLSFLRILENPWDELGWFRVLQLLAGVGAATARSVMDELGVRRSPGESPGEDPSSPLVRLVARPPKVPPAAREELGFLAEVLSACSGDDLAPALQVERIRLFYEPLLQRVHDNPAPRLRDIDQLAQIASAYPTRSRFITELTLDPPASTADLAGPPLLDEEWLTLSTIHSAKGCEWDVVHVIHASDGMIPSDMATGDEGEIEEELRLFYVALTRARNDLHVYFPLRYYRHPNGLDDSHGFAQMTRFLPPSLHHLFELRAPKERTPDGAAPEMAGAVSSVGGFLSGLWKG